MSLSKRVTGPERDHHFADKAEWYGNPTKTARNQHPQAKNLQPGEIIGLPGAG
jgi:hypothetical protein